MRKPRREKNKPRKSFHRLTPIRTDVGTLSGRDAILLSGCRLDRNVLTLEGTLNGTLCSAVRKDCSIPYKLQFKGILAIRMYELESYPDCLAKEFTGKGACLAEVKNSRWIKTLGDYNLTPAHRHLLCHTYDYTFEIVADGYTLKLGKPRK